MGPLPPSPVLLVVLLASAPSTDPWLRSRVVDARGCIEEARLRRGLERMLDPEAAPPATRLDVEVTPDGTAFEVSIGAEADGARLDRTLHGSDCETLTDAVALVLAVWLDPVAVAERHPPPASIVPPAPTASGGREPGEPPRTKGPAPPSSGTPRPARARPRATLGAGVGAEIGALPRAAANVRLDLGIAWPRVRTGVGGRVSAGPDATTSVDTGRGSARFRLLAAALYGCPTLQRNRAAVDVCGGIGWVILRARGRGFAQTHTVDALWVAPLLGVQPRFVPTPRVSVGGFVETLFPVDRHRFVVDGDIRLHAVGAVVVRAGLDVEIRLP